MIASKYKIAGGILQLWRVFYLYIVIEVLAAFLLIINQALCLHLSTMPENEAKHVIGILIDP